MFVNERRRCAGAASPPLPRRPTMLLLLLYQLLPAASSESTTSVPVTFVKPLESCPDVGYFFERELTNGVEAGPCYLCICKGTDHAVCSLRESERCDDHYYSHLKREARWRRSPGYARGAAKDRKQLSKHQREECKPLISSKSIGCPPDDWCVGCMVCDCSVDGHWNCHVMSFCPTQKSSKITAKKTRKSPPREPNNSRQNQKLPQSVAVASVPKKTFPQKKSDKRKTNASDDQSLKKIVKKSISYSQPMISVETKRQFQKVTTKDVPIIIKKYISTNSPIKSHELLKYKNDTKKFAQMLYKHYKSNVNNSPYETKKWSSKAMGDKFMNKRSLIKKNIKLTSLNARKPMNIKDRKDKSKTMNRKNKNNKIHDMIKKKKLNYNAKKYKGKKYDNGKRSKRDISLTTTEIAVKETNIESVDTANTTVPINKHVEATEISFTNSEDIASNLSNYAYTVDNHVTLSIPMIKTTNIDTGYVTTEQNVIVVTMDDTNFKTTDSQTLYSLQTERENDKKGNNTVKRNTIEDSFETTTIPFNILDVLKTAKIKKVNLKFIMDNRPRITHHQNKNDTENIVTYDKKFVHGQDIRKMFTRRKKISLTKLVKTLNAGSRKHYQNNSSTNSKSTSFRINGTLNDIQTVLEKLVHGYMRNHTQDRLKKKSNTAVKYLKKLFSKLFSVNNNKTDDKIAVMDSICENFGPCKIGVKKLGILNYKVNQLISETHKALSSIKIIKGLLQLVDEKSGNVTHEEPEFKAHVKKLNAILKDSYAPEDQLTETQATQIYYIKSNTQVFIKSIGKFANILNEIINLIKSENSKTKRTTHNYKVIKSSYPIVQERGIVSKIKNLLLRYNLLQNTFLRKMYEALTTLEVQNRNAKMYNYKKYRRGNDKVYKMEIEKYVDNINLNLRKLRDLAARVGSKERRKREAMGDDEAIEYLLTVMEYLLKRNNSLEAPPDNDGIDLLIEAIKSAPDIKPIKKKVLQYVPVKITGPTNSPESREENVSHPKKVRKPASENIATTKKEELEMDGMEIDVRDRYIVRDDVRKTLDSYTTPAELITKRDMVIADLSDVITEYPSKVYMATYDNYENTEKPFFEKVESDVKAIGESVKGIKKEDSAKEDENDTIVLDEDNKKVIPKNPSDVFAEVQTDPPVVVASTHKTRNEKGKMRYYNPTNSQHSRKGSKKAKTKLDLINEAYEEEIKEHKVLTTRKPDPLKSNRAKGETGNRDKKKMVGDVSSITKEIDEIKEKKESEDLIYKKQMDLLNSLDYGTEKSVADESDSKDVSSPLDRLNNDAFPNYFV